MECRQRRENDRLMDRGWLLSGGQWVEREAGKVGFISWAFAEWLQYLSLKLILCMEFVCSGN